MWGRVEAFSQDEWCRFTSCSLGEIWTLDIFDTLIYLSGSDVVHLAWWIEQPAVQVITSQRGWLWCSFLVSLLVASNVGKGFYPTACIERWTEPLVSRRRPMWKYQKSAFYCLARRNHQGWLSRWMFFFLFKLMSRLWWYHIGSAIMGN